MKTVNELKDESTKALEKNIADLEDINIMVRADFDRKRAAEEAQSGWLPRGAMDLNLNRFGATPRHSRLAPSWSHGSKSL